MAGSLYSASWYRVCDLKPRLRPHVRLHRQVFRGEPWHVVQDNQTGRFHRLSEETRWVVTLMDGSRTVDEIWKTAAERLGARQPTQDDLVRLLALMHSADLVLGGVPPHMEELAERSRRMSRNGWLSRIRNPMSLRFGLFDPDRFLARTVPLVRPLFTVWGLVLWLALITAGAAVAAVEWRQMTGAVLDQALTAQNVAILLLTYPVVKALHEMGHAYATRVWGGEVHELGVMILVFMPVPYVDATASSAFREKHRRMVVGAAGIMVETALAALAMFVWATAEPGVLRAVAMNVALIGSVSTVFFNGNPLLRLDGYWVLSDWIEIPNLAQRANRHLMRVVQSRLYGLTDPAAPAVSPGEARWFVVYAIASFVYRIMVSLGVAVFVATRFFVVGVVLAIVGLVTIAVLPPLRGVTWLSTTPRLAGRRGRALATTAVLVAAILVALFVVPLPRATMAEGVLWVGDGEATVRARADGQVSEVVVGAPAEVTTGAALVRTEDAQLAARANLAERQEEELRIRLEAVDLSDRVQANILREQLRNAEAQLADMRRSLAELTIVAPRDGRFLPLDPADLPGRFLHKGDVVGHVVGKEGLIVRAVVPQTEIDPVQNDTVSVFVRFVGEMGREHVARARRSVPAALAELPHGALTPLGGGVNVIDPSRADRLKPLDTVFQVDLDLADPPVGGRLGLRAHVRFEHPAEAIGFRLGRAVRQAFLRQFHE